MYAMISITKTGDIVATALAPDPLPGVTSDAATLIAYGEKFAAEKHIPQALVPGFLADLVPVLGATHMIPNPAVHDFALYMCWQYQVMPEHAKSARREIVESCFESHFGASWKSDLGAIERLDYYTRSLCLVPDALLEDEVRYLCMQSVSPAFKVANPGRAAAFASKLEGLRKFCDGIKNATTLKASVRQILVDTAYSRPLSKFDAFVASATKLLKTKGASGFFELVDKEMAKDKAISSFCVVRRCDAFDSAMNTFLQALPAAAEYIDINTAFFRAREMFNVQMAAVKIATVDALRAGMEMGDQNADTGPLLLAAIEKARATLDAQAQPAYMQPKQARGSKAPGNVADVDPNARAAWPVVKLAEWIDGPLAASAKPLDRKALVKRLQDERKPSTPPKSSADHSPSAPQVVAPDISEDQVGRVIQEGLKKSADYFLEDAQEMLKRATALKIDEAQLQQLCNDLKALVAATTPIDEEHARAVFLRSEELGDAVRQSVKLAMASQKFQKEFGAKLMKALSEERVVFGKRAGGAVECEALDDDWGFAVENFHNRWLPGLEVLAPDATTRLELGAHQAAAFYVTAGSSSGFAFDVSVHLWRRRAESSLPPGNAEQLLPPMDRTGWYDTYITCCVLHVPKWKTTTTSTAGRGRGAAQRGRGSRK